MRKNLWRAFSGLMKRELALTLAGAISLPAIANCKIAGIAKVNAATTNVMYGDVTGDGIINISDMILLKSYLIENNTKGFSVEAADTDGDGKVSAKDAVEISMYLLSEVSSFSCEKNIDTDGDGLCDYVEKEVLKTNYKLKDTDEDELDDYSEVYLCNTDPLIPDTGNTGTKDSLKDADGDGLTNLEEINLSISPALTDSDEDGLSDYDEVKKYKSVPSLVDTDSDGISDYGEIQLGLDPTKKRSDGSTYDNLRTFKQELKSDSPVLKRINNDFNTYLISLSFESSCFVDESVDVSVSGYSAFLMEDEIYGSIVDIECSDLMNNPNFTVNFELKNVTNPKDYMIFFYSDETGILLPTETTYNGKILSSVESEPGTYCIVNVSKMSCYYEEELSLNESKISSFDSVECMDAVSALNETDLSSSDTPDCTDAVADLNESDLNPSDSPDCTDAVADLNESDLNPSDSPDCTDAVADLNASEINPSDSPEYTDAVSDFNESDLNPSDINSSLIDAVGASDTLNAVFEIFISNNCTVPSWNSIQNAMIEAANKLETNKKNFKFTLVFTVYGYSVNIECTSAERLKAICETATNFFNDTSITSLTTAYQIYLNNRSKNVGVWKDLSSEYTAVNNIFSQAFYSSRQMIFAFNNPSSITGKCCGFNQGTLSCNVYSRDMILFNKIFCSVISNSKGCTAGEKIYRLLEFKSTMTTKTSYKTSLFGSILLNSKIASGSTTDSDGDGFSDASEIIKLCTVSQIAGNKKQLSKGVTQCSTILKTDMGSKTVAVVKSDPVKKDTDEDGIPDSEDKRPKKQDFIEVDTKLIDDSNIFDEGTQKIINLEVSGDGVANTANSDKPNVSINYNKEKYTKDRNSYPALYEIKPKKDGYYKITVDTAINDNCCLFAFRDRLVFNDESVDNLLKDKSTLTVIDTSNNVKHNNYSFFLEAGLNYKIDLTVFSLDNRRNCFDVKIEQDNWLKPDEDKAVIQKLTYPYNSYVTIEKMYIPTQALLDVLNDCSYNITKITQSDLAGVKVEDQTKYVMKMLDLDNDGKLIFDSTLTVVGTLIGGSAIAAAVLDPEPTTKSILIGVVGDGITTYFLTSAATTSFGFFEAKNFKKACTDGNLNLIYTKAKNRGTLNDFWEPWKTNGYINKLFKDNCGDILHCDELIAQSTQDVMEYCGFKA